MCGLAVVSLKLSTLLSIGKIQQGIIMQILESHNTILRELWHWRMRRILNF